MEMEDRRKRESRRILGMVEARVMKRLRAKEEEIEKIGKLNGALEERLRSLCVENQIWKDLAHTHDATIHTLQQALTDATANQRHNSIVEPVRNKEEEDGGEDDAESCCGSTTTINWEEDERGGGGKERKKWCRRCEKVEAGVVVLPCKHLCLCKGCGSTLHTCPICDAPMNATVHVNFS